MRSAEVRNMRCWRCGLRRSITAYVHEELPVNKAKRLEDHLLDCAECRSQVARLRAGHKIASKLPSASTERDPWSAIEAAIDRTPTQRASRAAWRIGSLARLSYSLSRHDRIAVALATAAIILTGVIVVNRHHRES